VAYSRPSAFLMRNACNGRILTFLSPQTEQNCGVLALGVQLHSLHPWLRLRPYKRIHISVPISPLRPPRVDQRPVTRHRGGSILHSAPSRLQAVPHGNTNIRAGGDMDLLAAGRTRRLVADVVHDMRLFTTKTLPVVSAPMNKR